MNKTSLALIVCAVLLSGAAGFLWLDSDKLPPGQAAMAEYRLENLSCGSCVSNINTALDRLDGVGDVEVNLTSNRGQVMFDPQRVDTEAIAATLTAAGYPAQLRTELSAREYAALQQDRAQLGQQYVARIGERLVAHDTFATLLAQRAGNAPAEQRAALTRTLWNELLQRELMLNAAEANGIIVQDGEIDQRLEELRQQHEGFDALIAARYPDRQVLRDRLREDLVIQRNLDRHVFTELENPQQKQQRFQQWFANLQQATDVVIFDPQIKALSAGGSGSGCSCCG